MSSTEDLSFLAPPGEAADWRMTVLFDAITGEGALAEFPGTADHIASVLGLDPHGLRVVLDALRAWGIVEQASDGTYALGAAAPDAA